MISRIIIHQLTRPKAFNSRLSTVNIPQSCRSSIVNQSITKLYINQSLVISIRTVQSKSTSKVDEAVKALKSSNQEKLDKKQQVILKADSSKVVVPKRSLSKRIWDELVHYYHGFRLLFIDIKISSKYVWRILKGGELLRREHRQLVRTVADLFRLVPFSVFIIVPFMELLLPVFIRFFPGLLPSTFQTDKDQEKKVKNQLKIKLDMAKFLQNTLDEMALQAKGESHSHKAKEFAQFFEKVRKSGEQASNEDIMKYSKLFEDEITLDSLSRPQLTALCRLLELQPIGPNYLLRFQLRMKLRTLRADDQSIQNEGLLNLTVSELQQACRARGMRALGVPEDRLRYQLQQWLELSLNERIPPSLLLLSRALYLPENITTTDQLKATIQTLPEELGTEARYRIGESEGKIDNRTKIELIKKEEAAINKEREELEQEKRELIDRKLKEGIVDKAILLDVLNKGDDKLKDIELTKEDLDVIEDAVNKISEQKQQLLIEKEELEDLKEEMKDYAEDIEEFKQLAKSDTQTEGVKDIKESKAAKRLKKRVDKMISKLGNVVDSLENKKKNLEEKIDVMIKEGKEVKPVEDNLINVKELINAVDSLKKVGSQAKTTKLVEMLDAMDVDHDGNVDLDVLVKVLELLDRENVNISSEQMKEIVNLVVQEDGWRKKEEEKRKKEQEEQAESNKN